MYYVYNPTLQLLFNLITITDIAYQTISASTHEDSAETDSDE